MHRNEIRIFHLINANANYDDINLLLILIGTQFKRIKVELCFKQRIEKIETKVEVAIMSPKAKY